MVSDYKFHLFRKCLKKEKWRPNRDLSMPAMSIFHKCCAAAAPPGGSTEGPSQGGQVRGPVSLGLHGCSLWQVRTFPWGSCESKILADSFRKGIWRQPTNPSNAVDRTKKAAMQESVWVLAGTTAKWRALTGTISKSGHCRSRPKHHFSMASTSSIKIILCVHRAFYSLHMPFVKVTLPSGRAIVIFILKTENETVSLIHPGLSQLLSSCWCCSPK